MERPSLATFSDTLSESIQKLCNRIADPTDSVTVDDATDVVWEVRQKLQSQFSLDSTRLRSNFRVDGGEAGSYLTKHW